MARDRPAPYWRPLTAREDRLRRCLLEDPAGHARIARLFGVALPAVRVLERSLVWRFGVPGVIQSPTIEGEK